MHRARKAPVVTCLIGIHPIPTATTSAPPTPCLHGCCAVFSAVPAKSLTRLTTRNCCYAATLRQNKSPLSTRPTRSLGSTKPVTLRSPSTRTVTARLPFGLMIAVLAFMPLRRKNIAIEIGRHFIQDGDSSFIIISCIETKTGTPTEFAVPENARSVFCHLSRCRSPTIASAAMQCALDKPEGRRSFLFRDLGSLLGTRPDGLEPHASWRPYGRALPSDPSRTSARNRAQSDAGHSCVSNPKVLGWVKSVFLPQSGRRILPCRR